MDSNRAHIDRSFFNVWCCTPKSINIVALPWVENPEIFALNILSDSPLSLSSPALTVQSHYLFHFLPPSSPACILELHCPNFWILFFLNVYTTLYIEKIKINTWNKREYYIGRRDMQNQICHSLLLATFFFLGRCSQN